MCNDIVAISLDAELSTFPLSPQITYTKIAYKLMSQSKLEPYSITRARARSKFSATTLKFLWWLLAQHITLRIVATQQVSQVAAMTLTTLTLI